MICDTRPWIKSCDLDVKPEIDIPDSKVGTELTVFANKILPFYKVPKLFEFIDAISIGKVNKAGLGIIVNNIYRVYSET